MSSSKRARRRRRQRLAKAIRRLPYLIRRTQRGILAFVSRVKWQWWADTPTRPRPTPGEGSKV